MSYLAFLIAQAALAGDFAVEGVVVERPSEAKQFGICQHFAVSPKHAALFFASARRAAYQDEEITIGPCKAFGYLEEEGRKSKWEIYIGGSGVRYRGNADPQWFYCDKECCDKVGGEVCG